MSDRIDILSIIEDKSKFIDFPNLNQESFKPAVLSLINTLKETVSAVTQNTETATWDNVVKPLDDASENLSFVWSAISHLNSVEDTPQLRAIVNELLAPISAVFSEIGQNEELYAKYKALKAEDAFKSFSAARRRIIDREIESFVLSGAELDEAGKKEMTEISAEEAELSQKFSENLLDCTNDFAIYLPKDTDRLRGIPEGEKALLRSRRPPKEPKAIRSRCTCRTICRSCSMRMTPRFAKSFITLIRPAPLSSLLQEKTMRLS